MKIVYFSSDHTVAALHRNLLCHLMQARWTIYLCLWLRANAPVCRNEFVAVRLLDSGAYIAKLIDAQTRVSQNLSGSWCNRRARHRHLNTPILSSLKTPAFRRICFFQEPGSKSAKQFASPVLVFYVGGRQCLYRHHYRKSCQEHCLSTWSYSGMESKQHGVWKAWGSIIHAALRSSAKFFGTLARSYHTGCVTLTHAFDRIRSRFGRVKHRKRWVSWCDLGMKMISGACPQSALQSIRMSHGRSRPGLMSKKVPRTRISLAFP